MRSRVWVPVAAACIVAVALLAWLRAGTDDAIGSDEAVTVAPRAFTATVSALGAVKAQIGAEVRVGSRLSGRVWRLRANIGDRVGKGQVLAELETAELDALIGQRRAELKLAEAKLASFDTVAPEEEARAQADISRFSADAAFAAQEWQRQQALLERLLAPRAVAEAAHERHVAAQAQLESARRTLEVVRTGNAERRKQAAADVERARAALESGFVDRSFTVLRSPIPGIVASVATQEGETVAAGLNAPTFVTIVDLDRLQLNAYVDEVDIGRIAPGQSAVFTVDAFPAQDFKGRVAAIYPSATIQDNVVKYVVAVEIQGAYGGRLRPEMTANVRIQLEERRVLAVPARAIRREDGRSVVYVQDGNRTAARAVRTGWRDGAWVEIVEGLAAGDRVLLSAGAAPREVTP